MGCKLNIMECEQKGKCFAKTERGYCLILKGEGYEQGKCPFQKPERGVTKGKYFPINENYEDTRSAS